MPSMRPFCGKLPDNVRDADTIECPQCAWTGNIDPESPSLQDDALVSELMAHLAEKHPTIPVCFANSFASS